MRLCRRIGTAAAALCAVALVAADDKPVELKMGDKAPVFEATDDTGKVWKSADHVGKKILVVYFFPGAFTGG